MRYITAILVAVISCIPLVYAAFTVHQDIAAAHQKNYTLQQDISTIQQEKATLQQENATLRSELDRMKQEASRSGNRRMMEISYYTPAADENGGYDGTSSGAPLTVGRTIAAGPGIPFGTRIFIPGVGWRTVEDRGGAIDNSRIDVLVGSKSEAMERGRHMAQVVIER